MYPAPAATQGPDPAPRRRCRVRADDAGTPDFAQFVTDQWPTLWPVATFTTGDADTGTAVTTTALAALNPAWAQLCATGDPVQAARHAVLAAALAADRAGGPRHRAFFPDRRDHDPGPDPAQRNLLADTAFRHSEAETRAAVAAVLAAAPAPARAVMAVRRWWHQGPPVVAAGTGMDLGEVQRADVVLRRNLRAAVAAVHDRPAHTVTFRTPGVTDDTLTELLEHAAATCPDLAPLALVCARAEAAARARAAERRPVRLALTAAATALTTAVLATVAALAGVVHDPCGGEPVHACPRPAPAATAAGR